MIWYDTALGSNVPPLRKRFCVRWIAFATKIGNPLKQTGTLRNPMKSYGRRKIWPLESIYALYALYTTLTMYTLYAISTMQLLRKVESSKWRKGFKQQMTYFLFVYPTQPFSKNGCGDIVQIFFDEYRSMNSLRNTNIKLIFS